MKQSDDSLDKVKEVEQLIKIMEKHKLAEVKMGDIHIKREPSQDAADLKEQKKLSKAHRKEVIRIADIVANDDTSLVVPESR